MAAGNSFPATAAEKELGYRKLRDQLKERIRNKESEAASAAAQTSSSSSSDKLPPCGGGNFGSSLGPPTTRVRVSDKKTQTLARCKAVCSRVPPKPCGGGDGGGRNLGISDSRGNGNKTLNALPELISRAKEALKGRGRDYSSLLPDPAGQRPPLMSLSSKRVEPPCALLEPDSDRRKRPRKDDGDCRIVWSYEERKKREENSKCPMITDIMRERIEERKKREEEERKMREEERRKRKRLEDRNRLEQEMMQKQQQAEYIVWLPKWRRVKAETIELVSRQLDFDSC